MFTGQNNGMHIGRIVGIPKDSIAVWRRSGHLKMLRDWHSTFTSRIVFHVSPCRHEPMYFVQTTGILSMISAHGVIVFMISNGNHEWQFGSKGIGYHGQPFIPNVCCSTGITQISNVMDLPGVSLTGRHGRGPLATFSPTHRRTPLISIDQVRVGGIIIIIRSLIEKVCRDGTREFKGIRPNDTLSKGQSHLVGINSIWLQSNQFDRVQKAWIHEFARVRFIGRSRTHFRGTKGRAHAFLLLSHGVSATNSVHGQWMTFLARRKVDNHLGGIVTSGQVNIGGLFFEEG
mmetsp:Transcript_41701/g.100403  ORF Transcript_41701/g.100403 Transcript_41701/m.100403 type:complete len:288 (-) Transcript_41701:1236-2099(-)